MTMLRNVIGLMFGASMSYYMFTLAGGIPISLNMNNDGSNYYDDTNTEYVEIQEGY